MHKDSHCESLFFVSIFRKKSYVIIKVSAISNGRKEMGLFDFLFGKKKQDPSFTLGVVNFSKGDDNCSDLMVVGFVKGSIKVGDEIVVTNMSCVTETPVKTTVLSLEVP